MPRLRGPGPRHDPRGALLRSRAAHLSASVTGTAPAGREIWQLKVTLKRTKPAIWRRLEVPGDLTLAALHRVVQGAFGWYDAHLHVFETAAGNFGVPDRELGFANERSVALRDVAPRPGDRLTYTYDFGDDWEHVIVVEKLGAAAAGTRYPRCTGGRRACPPEDCGGGELASWLEDLAPCGFDPARFDVREANERLAGVM